MLILPLTADQYIDVSNTWRICDVNYIEQTFNQLISTFIQGLFYMSCVFQGLFINQLQLQSIWNYIRDATIQKFSANINSLLFIMTPDNGNSQLFIMTHTVLII